MALREGSNNNKKDNIPLILDPSAAHGSDTCPHILRLRTIGTAPQVQHLRYTQCQSFQAACFETGAFFVVAAPWRKPLEIPQLPPIIEIRVVLSPPAHLACVARACACGFADSLYFLGLLKLYGISVSPDAAKALECIRKAAELRHLEAMAALGVMLLHGRGKTTA